MDINQLIADELAVKVNQVKATVLLLDEGATVPFIARYRKEVTGNLDDAQLRQLEERLHYLRELEARKKTILNSIEQQNKLTAELADKIAKTISKTELEDLYLPYKPKRKTKAQKAIEAGIEPLALQLLQEQQGDMEALAADYINKEQGFDDVALVLEGAKQILMEKFAEDAYLIKSLRETVWKEGVLTAKVIEGKESEGQKFKDYFNYQENISQIPSHRALALFRGRNEGILMLQLQPGADEIAANEQAVEKIRRHFAIQDQKTPVGLWLKQCVQWSWRIKMFSRIDLDLKGRLKELADEEAINVFARNLNDILLAAPAGTKTTMGLDPGIRTGVKVAVVDETGKVLATATIYPHPPRKQWDQSINELAKLIKQHGVSLISIGNGTASRETELLVKDLLKQHKDIQCQFIMVSESGASIYSASELASKELPDLDVSLRGAVSIARRLQDPLAELVKIDPKSIGVGQYQHDVNQVKLNQKLNNVVEDCVNKVGVDVNTASPALLKSVAGLSESVSQNIVQFREQQGRFVNRKQLLKVPRLGEKAYQQCAGFLRIRDGENPLDQSAVHPEAYPLVEDILQEAKTDIRDLIGNEAKLNAMQPRNFVNDAFGLPTVLDIFQELKKPGRDPRPEFKTATFKEGVETINDLQEGMELEGVVTNVTNFGAFVDIGVHQDGLVHISNLADRFIKSPSDVVKSGDLVKVQVLEVDAKRKRIALSMNYKNKTQKPSVAGNKTVKNKLATKTAIKPQNIRNTAFADALSSAFNKG